jgi:hypothetical protein
MGRARRTAARAIAICVGIAGLLTALGYFYGAPPLYQPLAASAATPLQSAIALMLLAAAIVMRHPHYGLPSVATGPRSSAPTCDGFCRPSYWCRS